MQLNNDTIINIKDIIVTKNNFYVVLEYYELTFE